MLKLIGSGSFPTWTSLEVLNPNFHDASVNVKVEVESDPVFSGGSDEEDAEIQPEQKSNFNVEAGQDCLQDMVDTPSYLPLKN